MFAIYGLPFTINIPHMLADIPYDWILWDCPFCHRHCQFGGSTPYTQAHHRSVVNTKDALGPTPKMRQLIIGVLWWELLMGPFQHEIWPSKAKHHGYIDQPLIWWVGMMNLQQAIPKYLEAVYTYICIYTYVYMYDYICIMYDYMVYDTLWVECRPGAVLPPHEWCSTHCKILPLQLVSSLFTKMQASGRGRIPSCPCAGRYIEYCHDKGIWKSEIFYLAKTKWKLYGNMGGCLWKSEEYIWQSKEFTWTQWKMKILNGEIENRCERVWESRWKCKIIYGEWRI